MFGNRFCAGVAVAVLAGQVVTAASVPAYAVAVPGGQSLAPAEYRFDCLRNVLGRAASTIENRPNYRDAARELRSLSRKLDGIVSKYQDRSAPRAAVGQRTYRAVSSANLEQARREASEAIDESVTKLLRSAGNSEKRKTHYSQIATAVGSTKRLLRS